jgi:hypothetical protein
LGIVDLSNFTWPQLWVGVAYILSTALFCSLGVLRLFEQKTRQGILLLVAGVICNVIFFGFLLERFFG